MQHALILWRDINIMITSPQNRKVKELIRLKKSAKERSSQKVFLVEGPKMFREIPEELCREVYLSESFVSGSEGRIALEKAGRMGCEVQTVADPVFQYLSDTQSPQGILAVARQLSCRMEDLSGKGQKPLILLLENLQDPGNLGTILRTAEAAGATGIVLSRGCADIYSPKVIRSTMGSIFRVPFVYTDHLRETIGIVQRQGVHVYAAHLAGSVDFYETEGRLAEPTAFLIGNESRGLSDETAALADTKVRIPMSGSVESLNAAIAGAVMLFEAKRQRRQSGSDAGLRELDSSCKMIRL